MRCVARLSFAFGLCLGVLPSAAEDPRVAMVSLEAPVAAAPTAPPLTTQAYDTLTVVLGGDVGLGGSGQPVDAGGAVKHGQRLDLAAMTRGLAGVLKGDVVFANLETVVTERNDLPPVDKQFNFRSHPQAVRHLLGLGFNVFSTANNHVNDYGPAGIGESVRHLDALKAHGLHGAPGTGIGRAAALAPVEINLAQARVLVTATGIGGPGTAGGARPAMAAYHNDADFRDQGFGLRDADGDVRILSVHFGQELQVRPSAADEARLRDAVHNFNVDLIAGHHAHVAAGVQEIDGRLIFYGLGNLLHPGMQDMNRLGTCRDFGVLARVHLGRRPGERYVVRAVEVWTLADMHQATRLRIGDEGRTRINVLNSHAAGLDDTQGGARGVRFVPQSDGSGLYCAPRAGEHDDAVAARCRMTSTEGVPLQSTVSGASCSRGDVVAERGRMPKDRGGSSGGWMEMSRAVAASRSRSSVTELFAAH